MKTATLALIALMAAASPALADTAMQGPAQAQNTVRLAVPARNIARGEIIEQGDLTYADVPATRAFGGAAIRTEDLVGKQARRFLQVGAPVRSSDVRAPILVTKGSTVTMTFSAPGINLTAVGKAMSEGGMGETVTVQNPVSFRQISATVTGPGTVAAGGSTLTVSDNASTARIASAAP